MLLRPQDCLYTVATRSGAGAEHRVVGAVLATEVARANPARLIARMADPATRIVSLTITEKGILPHAADRRTGRTSSRYRS